MTQNRDLRATVGYKVDQQSVAAASSANSKVAASFANVSDAVARLGKGILAASPELAQMYAAEQAAAAGATRLAAATTQVATAATRTTSALAAQRAPVQDLTNLYAGLEQQAKRAATAQDAVANGGGAGGVAGSGISSGFGTVRSLAGAAGLVAGNSQAGSTIAAFAGLASVLGPVGIGIAAIGVGFRVVSENAERAAGAIADSAKAYADVATVALTATRKQLEAERDAAELRRDLYQRLADDANQAVVDASRQPGFGALDLLSGTFQGLQQTADGANERLQGAKNELDAYNAVLAENITVVNDATQAQLANADRALNVDRMTREEREKEIARNQRDIEILTALAIRSDTTYDAMVALGEQIYDLRVRTEDLQSTMTSTADLQAREKEFRDSAAKALQDYNKQLQIEGDALTRAADIRQRINELTTDYEEKRRTAAQDAADKLSEIAADAAERRQQIDLDDADRRAEILKQFNRSYGDAIANRDALSAVKAKEQRDDELEKQDKAYQKQLADLQKQLDKQNTAVQRGLEKQQRSIDDAYNKQLRGLQQDLAEQNAIAENARQQQQTIQANYNALIAQANLMHAAQQYKTIYDYGEMTSVYLSNLWRKIADGARDLYNNGGYVVGGPDSGVYPGAGVGGNNLGSGGFPPLSDPMGNILTRSVNRPYLGGGIPSTGITPIAARGGGGLPSNLNVVINTPTYSARDVDKLWIPIRRKLLDAIS